MSLAILSLIGVGATALGFSGVLSIKDSTADATSGAVGAQLAQIAFGRDVQGSTGVVDACKRAGGSVLLVGLGLPEGQGVIEYRYVKATKQSEAALRRVTCTAEGKETTGQVLIAGLTRLPKATCDESECENGSEPRQVALEVPTDTGTVRLLGTRRTDRPEPPPTTSPTSTSTTSTPATTTTTTVPPARLPTFLALGGEGTPLQMSGSPSFSVDGDALFNAGAGGSGIVTSGNPRISITGDFALQTPATCAGCEKHANKLPKGFRDPVADPLASLPAPRAEGLPVQESCKPNGRAAVCSPGVYNGAFPSAPGGIGDYVLEPGLYVLRGGVSMSWGSLSGDGVTLYVEGGSIGLAGSTMVKLVPPREGPYAGVAVFQNRDRQAGLAVSGNSSLVVSGGMIYGASQHLALSGSSQVLASRMITRTVAMSGNVKVSTGEL